MESTMDSICGSETITTEKIWRFEDKNNQTNTEQFKPWGSNQAASDYEWTTNQYMDDLCVSTFDQSDDMSETIDSAVKTPNSFVSDFLNSFELNLQF